MAVVSRDKLYEQVWSRPMTKVAADYGITSTALKKTCVRHQIPTPERGYWAKRDHGKRVRQEPLPKLRDPRFAEVRIVGNPARRLPERVQQAKRQARGRLALKPPTSERSVTAEPYVEAPILAATRRAISKARPDKEGFVTASGAGIVPLRIGPSSLDRALRILSRFLALAKLQGYNPKATDTALVLGVDAESIAFGIEEQPQKTLHQPTTDELRRQDDYSRWGYSGTPWAKYDRSPSQRLAIVINENSYSGLRRTYADGKMQTLDELLPTILAGFAEHAALLKERRRAAEEQQRQWKEAEACRMREEAFDARERRRMEFVESINEQLNQRQKLTTVLAHIENASGEHAGRMDALVAWLRRRIQQIDAVISPLFLDISARCEELDFAEVRGDPKWEDKGRYRSGRPELKLWKIDEEKGEATSRSVLQWSIEAGLVPGFEASQVPCRLGREPKAPDKDQTA